MNEFYIRTLEFDALLFVGRIEVVHDIGHRLRLLPRRRVLDHLVPAHQKGGQSGWFVNSPVLWDRRFDEGCIAQPAVVVQLCQALSRAGQQQVVVCRSVEHRRRSQMWLL